MSLLLSCGWCLRTVVGILIMPHNHQRYKLNEAGQVCHRLALDLFNGYSYWLGAVSDILNIKNHL